MLTQEAIDNQKAWESLDLSDSERQEYQDFLASNDEKGIEDAFGSMLEFGTGGLRGIMGPGPNRMNRFTIGRATQGLSDYLKGSFTGKELSVAIAYDSRNGSPEFSSITANVFSGNGIKVFLFDTLRPTPELSFAIRHLGCQSGVVVTASHNPPEYNGYKVYWEDGAQIIAPQDQEIISTINSLGFDQVKFEGQPELIELVGEDLDKDYLQFLKELLPADWAPQKQPRIVFSSLHGTGITMVPRILEKAGFTDFHIVEEQSEPDGNFPTVKSPNPEERSALELGLKKAKEMNADLLMATDPDSDRVGIAIKDSQGEFILLNGNQTGALLFHFLLEINRKQIEADPSKFFTVKTIVTSELLKRISLEYNVDCRDTLTGFKYIADLIRKNEGSKKFLIGAEESYGYLIGDGVRDKDAISSCLMLAALTSVQLQRDSNLFDLLGNLYAEHGLFVEGLQSVVKKGVEGKKEIQDIMDRFRSKGLRDILGSPVTIVRDYLSGIERDVVSNENKTMGFPKSNVLQFISDNGSTLSLRPSGTEPKIKFYISSRTSLDQVNWRKQFAEMEERNLAFLKDLEN